MQRLALVALAVASVTLAAALPSWAQTSSGHADRTPAKVPWAGQGCGYGAYRAPNGSCDIVKDPNADCQPGFHGVPSAAGMGSVIRCVPEGY